VAGLTDLLDGTVARRFGQPSNFGGGLDPVVDGLFGGALCLGLAAGGVIPLWLAVVVIARYLLPALGGGLLIFLGRRPELRHTLTGQVSTVLILVLVGGVCLLRGLHQDSSAMLAGAEVVIPVATVATFAHLAWASRHTVAATEAG
jgi:phosphatidylglycerophosphate synthase